MRTKWAIGIATLLTASLLSGCKAVPMSSVSDGGAGSQPSQPQPPPQPLPSSNTAQLSVTLRDAPPAGVSVLSFEVDITGAQLKPVSGGPNVNLLPGGDPVDIEVTKLETESAVLNTLSAPAGMYSGLQLTMSNPVLTVFNGSPSDIGLCKMNTTCKFTPPNSGSITFSASPFPLNLVAGTPVALQIDILLNKIIGMDLSVVLNEPSVINVSQLPIVPVSGPPAPVNDNEFAGIITSIDTTHNTFVVQNSVSSMSETIHTDSNTRYEDFDDGVCPVRAFVCLATSQTVEVETILQSDGSILATEVKLEESQGTASIDGALFSLTGTSPTQFQMVVLDEEPDVAGLNIGDALTVALSGTTKFNIGLGALAPPTGASFAGPADLLPGQEIQIVPGNLALGPPVSSSASQVTLRASRFTATVLAVTDSQITVTNLPAVFGLTQLTVLTSSATEFEDLPGAASLPNGSVISIRGLLFKTANGPVVVAAKIRSHNHEED